MNQQLKNLIDTARDKFESRVVRTIRKHPERSYPELSTQLGIPRTTLLQIAKKHGIVRPRGQASLAWQRTKTLKEQSHGRK